MANATLIYHISYNMWVEITEGMHYVKTCSNKFSLTAVKLYGINCTPKNIRYLPVTVTCQRILQHWSIPILPTVICLQLSSCVKFQTTLLLILKVRVSNTQRFFLLYLCLFCPYHRELWHSSYISTTSNDLLGIYVQIHVLLLFVSCNIICAKSIPNGSFFYAIVKNLYQ